MPGFKDDKIFLLSVEECKKYEDEITAIPVWWWLRSPGDIQSSAACVNHIGPVNHFGNVVYIDDGAVRPALKYESSEKTIYCFGATWDKIDKNLYISRMPIKFMQFDDESNCYETSKIRKFLLNFIK